MRYTGGREVEVFEVADPGRLPGAHAALMDRALDGEKPRRLVYAPIYEARHAPFGLRARPGSHALGVTATRLLITEDTHLDGVRAECHSIPFSAIRALITGSALLQGWLAVDVEEVTGRRRVTLFYLSTGGRHVAAIVRECRAILAIGAERAGPQGCGPEAWAGIPGPLMEEMRPILVAGERPLAIVRSSARWIAGRERRWKTLSCASGRGVLSLTTHGWIHVEEEKAPRPETLVFGVQVLCLAPPSVEGVAIVEGDVDGVRQARLRLLLRPSSAGGRVEVPFDDESRAAAESLARYCAPPRPV